MRYLAWIAREGVQKSVETRALRDYEIIVSTTQLNCLNVIEPIMIIVSAYLLHDIYNGVIPIYRYCKI